MNTGLVFIRHGPSFNPDKLITGKKFNPPLSDEGKELMIRMGEKLKTTGHVPDAIYTSPSIRAYQSALAINSAYDGVPKLKYHEGLRDVDCPAMDGMSEDYLKGMGPYDLSPESEDPRDVIKRVREVLTEITQNYNGKKVFIVSHYDTIACIMWALLYPHEIDNLDLRREHHPREFFLERGAAFEVEMTEDGSLTKYEHIPPPLEGRTNGERFIY